MMSAAVAGLALALAFPQAGSADPKKGFPIHLVCSDGGAYDTLGEGQGEFDPVHSIDSTTVFVPTWLGNQTVTGYDDAGNVVFSESPPDETKGASGGRQPNELSCSFSFTAQVIDPQAGHLTIVGSGDVVGFRTT